jgi:kynurenine formamidase
MPGMKVYDLSQMWSRDVPWMLEYGGQPLFATLTSFEPTPLRPHVKGWYETILSFNPHTGTHVDAPANMVPNKWFLNEIPPDRLAGEGVVISIPKGEVEEITNEDLEPFNTTVRKGDMLLINTGWHNKFVGSVTDYEKAKYYVRRAPGLEKSGAQWIVDHGVKTLLVDWPDTDCARQKTDKGDDADHVSHKILMKVNTVIVENVGGQIDEVTGKRCTLVFTPPKFLNGDAFPTRVLALVP